MTKTPFKGTFPICHQKIQSLHLDLCGPISPASVSGSKYFLRVMDGYSHFVWIFFLTNKSQCISLIKKIILKLERQSNCLVSNIVSDNGTEFKNNELTTFYQQKGISHLISAPYTPEQNPFAKRGNCTTTPYFKLFEQHPFGCEATSLILPSPSKFSQKGELGIFIGYGEGHQTYWILNLETGNVKISHHVKFNYNIFPALSYPYSNKTDTFTISDNLYLPAINPNVKTSDISHPTKINPTQDINTPAGEEIERQIQPIDNNLPIESTALGEHTTKQTYLPKFKGYIWTNEPVNKSKEIVGKVGDPRNILDTSRQPKNSANFSELTLLDPKNYKQAINSVASKNWEEAISQELQNMAKYSVWSPCNEPTSCKPLTTTWVFKQTIDEDSNLTKFKARLCVRGFNQREGID
ncbi:hypothetical protein O181_017356 [Austropuccinia psidii MF-1]|uniref:Integrase catalytic domain-containing protein n=1 Tax=Austropuccinia psidii MF-1 TaxID=1389203 RepID=A0A9Q3GRW9_9BASI|nr:hypothetical protein [Austropuccinia psidii MF-1]